VQIKSGCGGGYIDFVTTEARFSARKCSIKCQTPSKAEDTRGRKPTPIFTSKKRRRFSTPKTDMAEKDEDDAVAAAIMHLYRCKSKQKEENVIEMYFHQFCTVYKQAKRKQCSSTTHNCFYRSRASEKRGPSK